MFCSAQSQMKPPWAPGYFRMTSQNSRKLPRPLPIACAYSPITIGLVKVLALDSRDAGVG